jgi:glycosyltransferase involved in cell wall biosynthesis
VEAMAAGKPVVAYARGGATETVVDGITGVLFAEQTQAALLEALARLDAQTFDRDSIRAHAERFDVDVFRGRMARIFEGLGVERGLYVT